MKWLKITGKKIAAAESCTGGLLSKMLTDTAGSSGYFLGGVIAYDDRVKTKFLKVPEKILKKHGAVSAETALLMAVGAQKAFGADIGLGITGIAGPGGGSRKKPLGLVYIALASRTGTAVEECDFSGGRARIRKNAAKRALALLRVFIRFSEGRARRSRR